MINQNLIRRISQTFVAFALVFILTCATAGAAQFYWTDWTGSDTDSGVGFQGQGTITTPTTTVTVTYTNPQGIGFYQANPGTDYWTPRLPVTDSPYTSTQVDNPPTLTDIVALRYAGNQTLQFSTTVANPAFSYVSLNGNGYAFLNQNFDILSFGAGLGSTPPGDNSCGYWGCGTSYKSIVDLGGGNFEYQLLGTGEPHGTIRFTGSFDTLAWRSLSNEYWNGFTVGVQGTAAEVFPPAGVPEPATMLLLGLGLIGVAGIRKKSKK